LLLDNLPKAEELFQQALLIRRELKTGNAKATRSTISDKFSLKAAIRKKRLIFFSRL